MPPFIAELDDWDFWSLSFSRHQVHGIARDFGSYQVQFASELCPLDIFFPVLAHVDAVVYAAFYPCQVRYVPGSLFHDLIRVSCPLLLLRQIIGILWIARHLNHSVECTGQQQVVHPIVGVVVVDDVLSPHPGGLCLHVV